MYIRRDCERGKDRSAALLHTGLGSRRVKDEWQKGQAGLLFHKREFTGILLPFCVQAN